MKGKLSLLLLALICISTFIYGGEKKKEFKIPYEKYKLSNGMDVILHVDRSDPIAAVYVVYHVGSAREEIGRTGFAHLFEHLRFNESQNVPQGQFFKKIQTAGGTLNGSTSNDRTNYFETVPKNALEMAMWMESDRMGFLLSKVNQATFITQQNVVSNEKRQGDNSPYSQEEYMQTKLLYPQGHPYSHTVIGSLEDLANASLKDAVDFHDKYYSPANATLVIAGDIDVKQTKKWVEKYFAEIKSTPAPLPLKPWPVKLDKMVRSSYEDPLANTPQLSMVFPTIEDGTNDAYALSFFARIFAGSKKSPLYKVIVEDKKYAASVSARSSSQEVAGEFTITIRSFPNIKLGDVEEAVKEAFQKFEKEGFTDVDVERQKAGIEFQFYNSITSIMGKARRLADYNLFNGSPDYLATDIKNNLSVTKEDVWRVYNKYIKGQNYLFMGFVPKGKADLMAPNCIPWIAQEESIDKQTVKKKEGVEFKMDLIPSKFDRTKEPVKGPDPVVKVPQIWTDKTANGIKVYGVKQSELPLVQFSIILKGGMLLDPADRIGVGSLAARLMNEGTKTKTPVELREAIQDLGANISIQGGSENISLSGTCLTSKFKETVDLAKEMLFEPRWDEKEFVVAKNQTKEMLKRSEAAPASIATSVFNKLIYGSDNILASQATGTIKSIETITVDDLKNYYNNYFTPSLAKITIVGDITKEKAIAVFNDLKSWKGKEVKIPEVKIASSAKPGIYFIDIPKAKQSEFRVGEISIPATDPDYYNLSIVNHKLGGDFNGILNMILREQKGFTYGARSSFSGSMYPGVFVASAPVQSSSTFETATIIRDEIAKYRQGIKQEDLDQIKSTLLKGYAVRFETLMALSQMLAPVVIYDLPFDYIKSRQEMIKKMTPDEHTRLAAKYIHPEKLIYVIAGDKATQFDKLKELGLGDPILLDKDAKPVTK